MSDLIDQIRLITDRRVINVGAVPPPRPAVTRLGGVPWATIPTDAPLWAVKQWIDAGLDAGVLDPDMVDQQPDTVFLHLPDRTLNIGHPDEATA